MNRFTKIAKFTIQIFILDDISDYCNRDLEHLVEIESISNKMNGPAIITLSASHQISNKTCLIRFSMPPLRYGLILGIDYISIKSNSNETCDDFLIVSGPGSSSLIKWCENKNDSIGESFKGNGYLDILFHAGDKSESEFQIAITPFEGLDNLEFRQFVF